MSKFKVSFEIEGELLADDMELDKENLEYFIKQNLSTEGLDYFGNRSIDCIITNLDIQETKE